MLKNNCFAEIFFEKVRIDARGVKKCQRVVAFGVLQALTASMPRTKFDGHARTPATVRNPRGFAAS